METNQSSVISILYTALDIFPPKTAVCHKHHSVIVNKDIFIHRKFSYFSGQPGLPECWNGHQRILTKRLFKVFHIVLTVLALDKQDTNRNN